MTHVWSTLGRPLDNELVGRLLGLAGAEEFDVDALGGQTDPSRPVNPGDQYRLEYAVKATLARHVNTERILDVHCGGGHSGAAFLCHKPRACYVGVDPDVRHCGWSPLAGAGDLLTRLYPDASVNLLRADGLKKRIVRQFREPFGVIHLGRTAAGSDFDRDLRLGFELLARPGVLVVSHVDAAPAVRGAVLDFVLECPEWPYYVRAGSGLVFFGLTETRPVTGVSSKIADHARTTVGLVEAPAG